MEANSINLREAARSALSADIRLASDFFMVYDESYDRGSLASYDDALISLEDAAKRYRRDRALEEKYREAEESVDEAQFTWSDVKKLL